MNTILASRLSRSDLADFNPPAVSDPYSNPTIAAGASASAHFAFDTGRISVLMVGGLVVIAAAFYFWTRDFQA